MSLSWPKLIRASPILNLILLMFLSLAHKAIDALSPTFWSSVISLWHVPYTSDKSNCSAPLNMLSFPCLCPRFTFCLQFPISDPCPWKSVLKQSLRVNSSTNLPEKISRVSVRSFSSALCTPVIPVVGGLSLLWMIMKEKMITCHCALER